MSKLYKWLATGHLGFLKIFGHFYKMLWYFFYQSKTNNRKTKKKNKGTTYLTPRGEAHLFSPAQPSRLLLSSSSPAPEAARWRAERRGRHRGPLEPPLLPPGRHAVAQKLPAPSPFLQLTLLLTHRRSRTRPK